MKKKLLAVLVTISMFGTCLAGCGNLSSSGNVSTDASQQKSASSDSDGEASTDDGNKERTASETEFKLGISINALDATTNRKMFQSAQSYAEELGIEVMATNAGDTAKQAEDIENLVQSGCNAIIVQNADSSVCANAIKEASDAGVYIISEESGWMDGVDTMISLNSFKTGAEMCNIVFANIGYKGKIIITGHNDHPTVRAHLNEFKIMAEEYSGIEIVNEVHTVYPGTTGVTYEGCASALVQNPDISAILCSQDLEALGAVQALKEAGLYPNVKVCGHDGNLDVLNEIKADDCVIMTIYPDTVKTTKLAVDAAAKLVNGETVNPYYEEPYVVVDDSNVDEYIALAKEDEDKYASK